MSEESTTQETLRVLRAALEDLDHLLTTYSNQSGEWVTHYVMPAAPWHRIIALIRGGLWPSFVEERLVGLVDCVACAHRALDHHTDLETGQSAYRCQRPGCPCIGYTSLGAVEQPK